MAMAMGIPRVSQLTNNPPRRTISVRAAPPRSKPPPRNRGGALLTTIATARRPGLTRTTSSLLGIMQTKAFCSSWFCCACMDLKDKLPLCLDVVCSKSLKCFGNKAQVCSQFLNFSIQIPQRSFR